MTNKDQQAVVEGLRRNGQIHTADRVEALGPTAFVIWARDLLTRHAADGRFGGSNVTRD